MLDIFICEDDPIQLKQFTDYVESYLMIEELDMELRLATGNPDELLATIQLNKKSGLYFLDVDLGHEMSGIMLGAEIRKYDPMGKIVFITTHSELTYLTFVYKVEAMDFILKDQQTDIQSRIVACMDTAYDRVMRDKNPAKVFFQTQVGDKVIHVPYDEILFFESSPKVHKIIMHLENRQVEFYGKLKDLENLGANFYRCHHSYVVNRENILEIKKKEREIIMTNEEVCYASMRYLKGLFK
ncbi:LytR/AlgR family response regulator transcription factor [Carnobacterium gallinarum]|uniref:LytR/AlgR family response regulator transcription factor n=1 Tax=Carnobacterium gallinarum TaxID=2749 RepID=UPI00055229CA|nr:LytTR family DNA-binding domain-containing protein [Carnobacterium gallinarum]